MSRVKKIRSKRNVALAVAVITAAATAHTFAQSTDAPVGQGFNVNRDDLRFILTQIRIAEEHARTRSTANPCNTQLGAADGSDGPFRIPNNGAGRDLPWGLRTVDGSCNNLVTGRSEFGAADNVFPRLVPRNFRAGETGDPDGSGPAPSGPTSYAQKSGTVIDSRPRTISNLIVDQSDDNPAAVAVRADAGAAEGDVEIPNVAPDTGLSAPFNSVFTFFGQFFDHGLDLVGKSNDLVFMPL
ncbi:MAG: peroxidase family protein, partial [Sporichthyaceae bacterium]